ncbi:MAG: arcadin 1 [Thaumarchaeota archaeon]|nr:arcadin 1 [Nitrososphaerota archaeon]
MTRVRVHRISSVTDPITGLPAKQIELVEVRERGRMDTMSGTDEGRVIQSIINQFQSMGVMPQIRELGFSKVTMVLTETEYDMFGIRLDVNEIYELEIKNGALALKKITEGT